MDSQQLAAKLAARVEFMILQHLPAPTCASKHQAHKELVREVKEMLAARLSGNNGVNIEIKV